MMKNSSSTYRVAIVTESLWRLAGANRVLEQFLHLFPKADVYALFGDPNIVSTKNVKFSFLNRIPLIKRIYQYTLFLWPIAIEQFDFTNYDLVISNSSAVAHGVVTPLTCKHISYINSPMRYLWDLHSLYSKSVRFGILKRTARDFLLHFIRVWDIVSSRRSDMLISNSEFVKKRISKYWDLEANTVIHPPVAMYKGKIKVEREPYYISCASLEPNKKGDFLFECAKELGFHLKVFGVSSGLLKKYERKYSKYPNIEFLGWISDEEKMDIISKAKGSIVPGIEDYGIFAAESISCGTPVLAYRAGGSLEIVKENESGMFFDEWSIEDFKKTFTVFDKKKWNYTKVGTHTEGINTEEEFRKSITRLLVE